MYAKKLQELRLQKGLSQEELSCKTGLTQIQISKHERGEKKNKVGDELLLIADYFNVSLDYLVGRDFDNSSSNKYAVKDDLDYYCSKLSEEDQIKVLEIAKTFYNLSKNK